MQITLTKVDIIAGLISLQVTVLEQFSVHTLSCIHLFLASEGLQISHPLHTEVPVAKMLSGSFQNSSYLELRICSLDGCKVNISSAGLVLLARLM